MELVKYLNYDTCQIIEKIKNSIVELPRYSIPTFIGNSGNFIDMGRDNISFYKYYMYNDRLMNIMYHYHAISENEFKLSLYTMHDVSKAPYITKEEKCIDSQYIFDLVDQLEYIQRGYGFPNNIHYLHANDFPEQVDRNQLKEMCIQFLNDPNYAPSKT